MNSKMVRDNAYYMAGRIIDTVGSDKEKQIQRVFLTAFCRQPSLKELTKYRSVLSDFQLHWRKNLEEKLQPEPRKHRSEWLALATFCHTILNSAEYLYID